jgi:hypothetical protein
VPPAQQAFFFLALFPVAAISAAIVIRSIGGTIARLREGRRPAPELAPPLPAPELAQMRAEIDELRGELERLKAAESFYAQLQAPADSRAG